jgi:hypothetical protein
MHRAILSAALIAAFNLSCAAMAGDTTFRRATRPGTPTLQPSQGDKMENQQIQNLANERQQAMQATTNAMKRMNCDSNCAKNIGR